MWWILTALMACDLDIDLGTDVPEAACDPRLPFWRDADADGYGDPSALTLDCAAPDGWVDNDDDCDDTSAAVQACDSGIDSGADSGADSGIDSGIDSGTDTDTGA